MLPQGRTQVKQERGVPLYRAARGTESCYCRRCGVFCLIPALVCFTTLSVKILSPAVLTLLCLLSIPASAAVTIVSGNVYDNGKYSYRTGNGLPAPYSDSAMCWAAAASNVIQYWQDTYGGFAAAGTPTGINTTAYAQPQGTGSLNVYNTFLQNWTNSSGHPYNGISWWMQGGLYDSNSASKPADGTGGYYTAVFGTEHPDHASDDPLKNASFYDYYLDKGAKEQHYTRPGLAEMKATLQKAFATQGQAVALGLFSEKTYYSHSITCWGYETDDEGNITSLIVSDSDDKKYGTTLLNLTEGVGADGKVRTYISTDRRNGFAADTACTLCGGSGVCEYCGGTGFIAADPADIADVSGEYPGITFSAVLCEEDGDRSIYHGNLVNPACVNMNNAFALTFWATNRSDKDFSQLVTLKKDEKVINESEYFIESGESSAYTFREFTAV